MKLRKVTSVIWPVVAHFPADGGEVDKHHFWVKFIFLNDEQLNALGEVNQSEFLKSVIDGVGETEDSVKKDTKTVSTMLADPYYTLDLYTEYANFRNGALEKNLSAWGKPGQETPAQ